MNRAFKGALIVSAGAHMALLLVFIVNPSLPKARPKGQIHYISMGNFGGSGGGGLRSPAAPPATVGETPLPNSSLRDLTTAEKLQKAAQPELRYPADKKKRGRDKPKPDKTASVSRPEAKAGAVKEPGGKTAAGGGGSGLTIGAGGPGFGEGSGLGGYGDQIGMSTFPYAYYLQNLQDRISARWFQSLVDPGAVGTYRVTVHFRIFRNGEISAVEVKESSSLRSLDLSAIRAIMSAAPFPPLPADYDEPYLGIILIFEHAK